MKRYLLAVLMLAVMMPTFATAEGIVVSVIFIARDEKTGDLTYHQFDEIGRIRECIYSVKAADLTCTHWIAWW
jgi:hypothetical protein